LRENFLFDTEKFSYLTPKLQSLEKKKLTDAASLEKKKLKVETGKKVSVILRKRKEKNEHANC